MLLEDLRGFVKKQFTKTPEQLIDLTAKELSHWRDYKHLAYSKRAHRQNQETYRKAVDVFFNLQKLHNNGVDVSDKLQDFYKEVKKRARNIP